MAKGELCEKQPRFTDNCGEYWGCLGEKHLGNRIGDMR